MKRTLLDKVIGYFSPESEFKRLHARGRTEFIKRAYDAAQTFKTDDWVSATSGSANTEIRGAQKTLRDKGRDAVRNNPYANKAVNVIVSNVVGAGIVPNIKAKSKLQKRRLQDAWKEWGETTLCDSTGKHNFYGLQALAMRSTVESGEAIVLKEIEKDAMKLKLIESDYIVSNIETAGYSKETEQYNQGIKVDKDGKALAYVIYSKHPGDSVTDLKYSEIPASKLLHVLKVDRPGQLRGVSWFHPVIRPLADFNEYQQATLINRKVSACFTAFITRSGTDSVLSNSDLRTKRENQLKLEPASVMFLEDGEQVQMATPPAIQGYDEYCRQVLREIAAGIGITYEDLTGDYSQVNYSSGRMGREAFRRNVETWQWNMLIPQFCEPAFEHFLEWCRVRKGIQTEGVTCEWVTPAWSMIDPTKELPAMATAIRDGLITYEKALLELGYDPENHIEEIATFNKLLDAQEIILDTDPRKTSKAGQLQVLPQSNQAAQSSGDNLEESQNLEE